MHVSIGRRKPAAIIAAVATATVLMAALTPAAQAEPDSASENTETIALVEELIPATEQVELAPATQIGDELLVEGGDVKISSDASEGTEFALPKGLEMTIAPIADAGAQEGAIVDGQAVTEISEEITVVTQPIEDGARMISVLETPAADTAVDYSLELPTGTEAVLSEEGGVDVWHIQEGVASTTRTLLAQIDAPWAADANGRPVETRFELSDGVLTQVVTPTADTTFPVVADPSSRVVSCGTVSVSAALAYTKGRVAAQTSWRNCGGHIKRVYANLYYVTPEPPTWMNPVNSGNMFVTANSQGTLRAPWAPCEAMPYFTESLGLFADGKNGVWARFPAYSGNAGCK
jgi:hypothetical protein